ncbi:hypothetical protein DNTS_003897 [Danionella cerebrum]|uniref:SEA domain-containing protein n=1 Tax=Danionella cerebrum TaxID=2873325 RepID=A0A553N2G0_9TELE|nr:hypothetical protein DNTS_003897 [Danionella translucida]
MTPGSNSTNTTTLPITTPGNNATVNATTTPGNSTVQPITNSTIGPIVSTTNPTNTTTPPATCPQVPCPPLSVCENSVCQCLAGTVLLNNVCVQTKTFPSSLRLNRTFVNAMEDPQSPEFKETANEITAAVNEAMRIQQGYIRCTVLKLTRGSVVASVNTLFQPDSPVTQVTVSSAINTAIDACGETNCGILADAEYTERNLCDQDLPPCEVETTVCKVADGVAECDCKPDYVPNLYQTKSCQGVFLLVLAQVVSEPRIKHVFRVHLGTLDLTAMTDRDLCVRMHWGTKDSTLLALVVVACVLGGLLLIAITGILVYICVAHGKKKSDINYNSPYPTEDFRAAWPDHVSHIPRATLSAGPSNEAFANSLEMSESKKGHSNGLTGSYNLRTDGMNTFKDPKPTRYSYLVGHENPYFIQGDEKR